MIRFLRQMVGLPYVITGFWLTQIGDALADIGARIEGADTPISDREALRISEEVPNTDGDSTAA